MTKVLGLVAGLVIASLLLLPGQVHAATTTGDSFNLTTSPLPVSLTAKPGSTISTPIRVENTGAAPVQIKVSLMKFSAYGNTGQPEIENPGPADTYVNWVSFSQTDFIAQPGVFNTVTMTIKLPKDAAFGYYYAVVFSQVNTNPAAGARQTTVNGAVATLVLLNANVPGEKRQLQVTSFTVSKKFYEYLPATFTVSVHNTGNIHVIPTGNIFITKNQKDDIATLDINAGQGNILPNSNRQFQASWDDGFPHYQPKRINGQVVSNKNSQPEQQLVWDFANVSKLRIGRYYAQMELVYNNGTQDVPIQGLVSFWVIPWRLLLIGLVVITLVLLGVTVLVRSILRRVKKLRRKQS